MRRSVPFLTVALVVAVLVACGGDGGGTTTAFCDSVRELRKMGREPGTEPADPQQLEATIAGLRDLERSAPSDLKGEIATIRDALETIASLGGGKRVDPKKIEQLAENDQKIREAGKDIDRHVEKCGIKVPRT